MKYYFITYRFNSSGTYENDVTDGCPVEYAISNEPDNNIGGCTVIFWTEITKEQFDLYNKYKDRFDDEYEDE